MLRLLRNILALMVISFAGQAMACPDGYYKDGMFGACLPTGKKVVHALNPAQVITNSTLIVQGLAEGNGDKLKQGIGGMILHSQCAISCEAIAANVLPKLSPEQLKRVVGEGFIVFATTGDPYLTVIDTGANVARQLEINGKTEAPPISAPPPAPRPQMEYTAVAVCIVQHIATLKVVAGWIDPPQLAAGGSTYTFPAIDLRQGDLIKITAPDCPAGNNPGVGQQMLTSATISYLRGDVMPGPAGQMKFFITGTQKAVAGQAAAK
ncbi:hypothetical protein ACCS91_33305 [Rhizobium ruizarguesonis]